MRSASIWPIFIGCLHSSSGYRGAHNCTVAALASGHRKCQLFSASIHCSQSGENSRSGRITRNRHSVGFHASRNFWPGNQHKTARNFLESGTTHLERSGFVLRAFWIPDWGNPSRCKEFTALLQNLLPSTRASHFPDLRNHYGGISFRHLPFHLIQAVFGNTSALTVPWFSYVTLTQNFWMVPLGWFGPSAMTAT